MTRRENAVDAVSSVRLFDDGGASSQSRSGGRRPCSNEQDGALVAGIGALQQEISVKVLKLCGLERCFRRGQEKTITRLPSRSCTRRCSLSLPGDCCSTGGRNRRKPDGGALCDFMVCNEDAAYGPADLANDFYPATPEVDVLVERVGTI